MSATQAPTMRLRPPVLLRQRPPLLLALHLRLCVAAVVSLAPLGEASAQSFDVHAGPCIDASRLSSALEAIGARVPAEKAVTFRVAEADGAVSLEVRQAGVAVGKRTIETHGLPCDEVLDAVALAMAVTTDALFVEQHETQDGPATAPAPPPAKPLAQTASDRPRWSDSPGHAHSGAPVDRRPVRLASSLELGSSFGMMPQPSAVASSLFELAIGPASAGSIEPELSARAGIFIALPTTTELDGAQISTSLIAGRLDLCGGAGTARVRLRGCATGIGGGVVADGGEGQGRLAMGGRVDVRWRLMDGLGVQAGADLLGNITPDHVTLRGRDGGITHFGAFGPGALIVSGGPIFDLF